MSQGDINKTCELGRVLVTGGAGFVGRNFVQTLLEKGHEVTSLDLADIGLEHENLTVFQGDIRDASLIEKAVKNIDTVFHTASVIETNSGAAVTEKQRQFSFSINVDATRQLLTLARQAGARRFVYTSSNSVVIGGQHLEGVDESCPYTDRIRDLYTETKIIAEKWVLSQNGVDGMLTCALRPSSIWGPGERMLFRRAFEQILGGFMMARIGGRHIKLDNTFVHNLIHAEILAAEHLVEGGTAPGQAYFINDGEPVNAFDFCKPVFDAIGASMPDFYIPGYPVVLLLRAWEYLHFKLKFPAPPLTPLEAERVTFNNYFSIAKAERELGYKPLYNTEAAMKMSMPYYIQLFEEMKAEANAGKSA